MKRAGRDECNLKVLHRSLIATSVVVAVVILSDFVTGELRAGHVVSPSLAEESRELATGWQARALADAHVSFEEYAHGVSLTVACMESDGVDVEVDISIMRDGRTIEISFPGMYNARTEQEAISNAVFDDCEADQAQWVNMVWHYQWRDGPQAGFRLRQALSLCLLAHGVLVPDVPSDDDLAVAAGEHPDAYRRCLTAATAKPAARSPGS